MSHDITIEIDLDEDTVIIIPESGKVYQYDVYEIDNDIIDRLLTGGSDYTVYSQSEILTEDELDREDLIAAIRGEQAAKIYQER